MPEGRSVGIRDVARAAGVSITTVSHALNDKAGVSDATRRRVREVADHLGYRPDPRGRHLSSGRTGLVALTVSVPTGVRTPVAEFAHNSAVIEGAAAASTRRELALVIVPSGGGVIWQRLPLDGAIVVDPSPGDPAMHELARARVPVVTIGRITEADPGLAWTDYVDNDYVEGTLSVLHHLRARGARRIGVLGAGGQESYAQDSLEAYRTWCVEAGQEPWTHLIENMDWTDVRSTVGREVAAALDRSDRPDAFHCLDEVMALALLRACGHRGVRVPEDLLVSSISDRGRAEDASPSLTTLELHPRELGETAAGVLADLLAGLPPPVAPVFVETTVVPRGSTAVRSS
jgi:DNA-binding LacI/PurR family transcriptional regulator